MTQTLFISFIICIYSFAKLSLVYFQCLQTEYMTTNKTKRKLFSVYQYFYILLIVYLKNILEL